MIELRREAIICLCIMVGIMIIFVCAMIVYHTISDIKEKKKKPKIEELQRQLEYERATTCSLRKDYQRSYDEHKALALAVMLCKDKNLNLKQLQELGLQRYNALQERGNFITDLAYEELVKHYIIIQGARHERNYNNQSKKNQAK